MSKEFGVNKSGDLEKLLKEKFSGKAASINRLLAFCSENNCSDLYIKIGEKPFINRYGFMYEVPSYMTNQSIWNDWASIAISSEMNMMYNREKMLDTSYIMFVKHYIDGTWEPTNNTNPDETLELRYRVSCGFSRGKKVATFRMISPELPSFKNLNFSDKVLKGLKDASMQNNGVVILAGPTGSGKTTTMSAALNDFTQPLGTMENSTIISLEDPIEYIYPNKYNVNIIQKELGKDFRDFSLGIKQSLREHPKYIVVGESRDRETIKTLVEASRTGHMVFTSFHSSDVSDTISRIYNHLVSDNPEIMYDLISQMNMILCQRIRSNGAQFILETQYMKFNNEIINYINENIQKNINIKKIINSLFKSKRLAEAGLVKDWD